MSKIKFLSTNRDRFTHQKTQQLSPYEMRNQRKNSERNRQILIPIERFPIKKGLLTGKTVHSEGKYSERQQRQSHKIPIVDLLNLKESFLLKKQSQSVNLKNITKKLQSNRLITEKAPLQNYSIEKKLISPNKIIVRGGGFSKELTPEKRNLHKNQEDKVWVSEKNIEKISHSQLTKDSLKKNSSLDKKYLTAFEMEESKNFQIYYIGTRRIYNENDFSDAEGDPKVAVGDAIAYKYEIISQLGRGSFGRVFKAFDHKKKEHVALKIIKNQEKFTRQAKVEVEILQTALFHDPKLRSNIVRLKGSFIFRGHSCLKFEILSKNLYEFIKESNFSGFSLDLIRRFSIQILQALHFFSKHKIIHCDLKPQNILLKEENKSGVKVIDVGSGCFHNKQIYTYIQSRFYRAPEIVLGIKYTSAIDMWSFGCILVELYTGIPIFPGQSENQQMLMFIQILGLPPAEILEVSQRKKKFFNEKFECKIPQQKGRQKLPKSISWSDILGVDCDPLFINLVERCLEWNSSKRITPKEALLHEWIISGLPVTIRNQHIEQLSTEP